jgi:6-pyruvoyltetrahydropterin/6-carboxytetrahydropterin synthase
VIDFSVIKERLCQWLEDWWDHKFLIYNQDPWAIPLKNIDRDVVIVPFNPTAENMAMHLLSVVGPLRLKDTGVTLVKVIIEETRKCQATASI